MEKQIINKGTGTLAQALQQILSLYYNFNLVYPKEMSTTLEFLQSHFLKNRPQEGTKDTKKPRNQMKLLSLANKLRDNVI